MYDNSHLKGSIPTRSKYHVYDDNGEVEWIDLNSETHILTPREQQLIRDSWSIIVINESNREKLSQFYDSLINNQEGKYQDLIQISRTKSDTTSFQHNIINNNVYTIDPHKIIDSPFYHQLYKNYVKLDSSNEVLNPNLLFITLLINDSIDNLHSINMNNIHRMYKIHRPTAHHLNHDIFHRMGLALLKTFENRFGPLFTQELQDCWIKLYSYLSKSFLLYFDTNSNKYTNNTNGCEYSRIEDDSLCSSEENIEFAIPVILEEGEARENEQEEEVKEEEMGTVKDKPITKITDSGGTGLLEVNTNTHETNGQDTRSSNTQTKKQPQVNNKIPTHPMTGRKLLSTNKVESSHHKPSHQNAHLPTVDCHIM